MNATSNTKPVTCTCFIKHAITSSERRDAAARLAEARELRDTIGITMAMASLSECPSVGNAR